MSRYALIGYDDKIISVHDNYALAIQAYFDNDAAAHLTLFSEQLTATLDSREGMANCEESEQEKGGLITRRSALQGSLKERNKEMRMVPQGQGLSARDLARVW